MAETGDDQHPVTCECVDPDWYHDGVESICLGRLCRTCRRREGRDRYRAQLPEGQNW